MSFRWIAITGERGLNNDALIDRQLAAIKAKNPNFGIITSGHGRIDIVADAWAARNEIWCVKIVPEGDDRTREDVEIETIDYCDSVIAFCGSRLRAPGSEDELVVFMDMAYQRHKDVLVVPSSGAPFPWIGQTVYGGVI